MIEAKTLKFLASLSRNNSKEWFDKHRDEYEAAKLDIEHFVTQLLERMAVLDPAFAEQKAKQCIFRIYRDVRFSKDKTPYKSHFGIYVSRAGKKAPDAGYYIHIEPGKSFLAGGLWMPEGPLLKATRQEIDYNFDEFSSIIKAPAFRKTFKQLEGEKLKTLPQGYSADNPAIEYLKMKSFIASHQLTDDVLTSKNFTSKVKDVFAVMKPLVDFLNRSLD